MSQLVPTDGATVNRHDQLPAAGTRLPALLGTVGVVALALGTLTAFAQGWLPARVGSLANSAGTWVLVAFLLSLLAPRLSGAALSGLLSLVALVAGYYATSELRGNSSSLGSVAFWVVAALVVGPLLGICAHWVRVAVPLLAAVGEGVPAGTLIGEGIYGLTRIADTTYPPYWWGEIVVGVALLGVLAAARLRGLPATALATATATATAVSFVLVFGGGLGTGT